MTAPIYKNYSGLIYTSKNGQFTFAERIRYTENLRGQYNDAILYAQSHQRGTVWSIAGLNGFFIVEQSSSQREEKAGVGTVEVVYLWLNSVPPDKWTVTPFEISPPLHRANYFSNLTSDDLKKAKASFVAAESQGQTSIDTAIAGTTNATLTQALVNKWLRGEETFYMPGLKYQWITYFTSLAGVLLRRGGYIETPGGPGAFPFNFTWLRQCDEIGWDNGLYTLTRTWIGAPSTVSFWDTDLYGIPAA